MKYFLLTIFFSFLCAETAFSCESSFLVHRRETPKSKIEVLATCIPELAGKQVFENKSLKIVEGVSNNAISINDQRLKVRAATVFYHTTKAQKYFEQYGSDNFSHIKQLVIRLELDRNFLDISHYAGEHIPAQYNNALTIPPSDDLKGEEYDSWGYEIWFRPKKLEKNTQNLGPVTNAFENPQLRESILIFSIGRSLINITGDYMENNDLSDIDWGSEASSAALTLSVLYILPKAINYADGKIKTKFYLDTALIPEVIYHEYAHVALAKYLKPKHGTPVIEGLANFFATEISEGKKIAHKAGKRERGVGSRKADVKSWYDDRFETRALAQHNFTFQLLFAINEALPTELKGKVIFEAAKELTLSSDIKYELMESILYAIRQSKTVKNKQALIMRVNRIATEYGL